MFLLIEDSGGQPNRDGELSTVVLHVLHIDAIGHHLFVRFISMDRCLGRPQILGGGQHAQCPAGRNAEHRGAGQIG